MGRLASQLLPPQLSVIPKRPCAVRRHFRKRLLAGALQKNVFGRHPLSSAAAWQKTKAPHSGTLRNGCVTLWDASTVSRPTMGRLPSQLLPPQLSVIPKRPCAVRRHFRKRLLAGALQKMYSAGTHYRPPLRGKKPKRPIVGRSATVASHCGTLPPFRVPL